MMASNAYTPPEGYVTLGGAAELLSTSRMTARKRIAEARLKLFKDPRDPRARLVRIADVEALAAQGLIEVEDAA